MFHSNGKKANIFSVNKFALLSSVFVMRLDDRSSPAKNDLPLFSELNDKEEDLAGDDPAEDDRQREDVNRLLRQNKAALQALQLL